MSELFNEMTSESVAFNLAPHINYNPDVLSCLANLSNDEVFTPPELVNQMLDMLPADLWTNPNAKFLDPVTKSGVFLREIVKRLIAGLEIQIPDLQTRINHICTTQVYGIAITELTSLLARRSVYCAKAANSALSICTAFDANNPQGNIRYERTEHTWTGGKCSHCGANQAEYDRDEALENHAYRFIHTDNPSELFGADMKFDVIIGNPPYQLSDGGSGVSAKPLFHHFVEQAKKLQPNYLLMIIPARWYAGGKGLDEFRERMLNDSRISTLVDYESSKDCFDGVNIAGGICYFLWSKNHNGLCEVINTNNKNNEIKTLRKLNQFPVFIRNNQSISIVEKVLGSASDTWNNYNYPRNPFGFATKERGSSKHFNNAIKLLSSNGFGFIKREDVIKNTHLIGKFKILIGRLVPSNGELDVNPADGYKVITNTRIIGPDEITTESYLMIGAFDVRNEANNFDSFIKTRFVRFLLRQAISSLNVTKECFRFVPYESFSEPWTDEKLYAKYGLTADEIAFVESMIRPMDLPTAEGV